MRPKKRVLLFCADETLSGLIRYRMELRHAIRVTAVHTKEALVAALLDPEGWRGMVHIVSPSAPNESVAALMAAAEGEAARVEIWPERERELYDPSWSTAHRVVWTDNPGLACPVVAAAMRSKRGPKRPVRCPLPQALTRQEVYA